MGMLLRENIKLGRRNKDGTLWYNAFGALLKEHLLPNEDGAIVVKEVFGMPQYHLYYKSVGGVLRMQALDSTWAVSTAMLATAIETLRAHTP